MCVCACVCFSGSLFVCIYFLTELIYRWSSVVNYLILETFRCD